MGIDPAIDITTEQRKTVLSLLEKHLPNTTVWVYGSRVKWTAHPQSDLDMVVFATPEQNSQVFDLREALEESNLPFRVDLFVWDDVPERFRKHIKQDYVVFSDNADVDLAGKNWLYHPQLPRHWKRKSLYAMAQWVNGLAFREIQFSTTGKPVIKIAEIKGGISGQTKFTQQTFDESVRIRSGDLLFSWSGQPETSIDAFWWRGPEGWLNQHVFRVTPINGVDSTFFFYLLRYLKPNFVAIARNKQTTGLGHVTKRDLENIEAALPDLSEQRAIADILGTLDDKIELNRRMNETLEEMARALFKSWFVDFDPVRAKAALKTSPEEASDWTVERASAYLDSMDKSIVDLFPDRLVDSELGEIPEGWEVKALGECYKLTMGQSPPGSTYNDDGKGLPFFQGNADFDFRYPNRRRYCTEPTRIAYPKDTLVSVRAPVGAINMAWQECCIGRGVAALRHISGSASFTYYTAWALQKEIQQYEHTGTVFGAINKKQFESMSVIQPKGKLIEVFESRIQPLDERIRSNESSTRNLADQRGALLPKLVGGQLKVGK